MDTRKKVHRIQELSQPATVSQNVGEVAIQVATSAREKQFFYSEQNRIFAGDVQALKSHQYHKNNFAIIFMLGSALYIRNIFQTNNYEWAAGIALMLTAGLADLGCLLYYSLKKSTDFIYLQDDTTPIYERRSQRHKATHFVHGFFADREMHREDINYLHATNYAANLHLMVASLALTLFLEGTASRQAVKEYVGIGLLIATALSNLVLLFVPRKTQQPEKTVGDFKLKVSEYQSLRPS